MRHCLCLVFVLPLIGCGGDALNSVQPLATQWAPDTVIKLTVRTADSTNRRYSAPSLATRPDGRIALAYDKYGVKADDTDPSEIDVTVSEDGREWDAPIKIADGTNPNLVVKDGALLVFYDQRHSNQDLRVVAQVNGITSNVTPPRADTIS